MKLSTLSSIAVFLVTVFGGIVIWYKFGMSLAIVSLVYVGCVVCLVEVEKWIKRKGY